VNCPYCDAPLKNTDKDIHGHIHAEHPAERHRGDKS
jgi:hypothetical protein